MKHDFSIWQLLKFVSFVAVGLAGLPLFVDSLDGFSAKTRLPQHTSQALACFGAMFGAIIYFFMIPASDTDDQQLR